MNRRFGVAAQLCAILFVVCGLFWSRSALAYRTAAALPEISSSTPVVWSGGKLEFFVYASGSPSADERNAYEAMLASFPAWEGAGCGSVQLSIAGYTNTPAHAADGRNTVTRVVSGWSELGFPAGAAAYTDVAYFKDKSGWSIVEADIYINAEDFEWVPFGATSSDKLRSLQPILTHEIGHALGLLHPCEENGSVQVPACAADPSFRETMMYPTYDGTKLALAQDDIDGLCSIYGCSSPCESEPMAGPQPVPPPTACALSAECAAGQSCHEYVCADGYGLTGDPCVSGHSCASGICSVQGYCVAICDATTASAECSTEALGFGQACENAGDCLGAECLKGAGPVPICTRECSNVACPGDWACATVMGKSVCTPSNYRVAGGTCSMTPGLRVGTPGFGLMWGLIYVLRRRCRRSSARVGRE